MARLQVELFQHDNYGLVPVVFRSDHVSNHMVLKGILGKHKSKLLNQIDQSIRYFQDHPEFQQGDNEY